MDNFENNCGECHKRIGDVCATYLHCVEFERMACEYFVMRPCDLRPRGNRVKKGRITKYYNDIFGPVVKVFQVKDICYPLAVSALVAYCKIIPTAPDAN